MAPDKTLAEGGIDESVLLPQLRQEALLIPWKEDNIWVRLSLQVQSIEVFPHEGDSRV